MKKGVQGGWQGKDKGCRRVDGCDQFVAYACMEI
jgi:hypothetical protein